MKSSKLIFIPSICLILLLWILSMMGAYQHGRAFERLLCLGTYIRSFEHYSTLLSTLAKQGRLDELSRVVVCFDNEWKVDVQSRSGLETLVANLEQEASGSTATDPGECLAGEPPEEASAELERVKPLLEQYTRLRLDATGFANAVAGFWFSESQRAGKYFLFGVWNGSELRSERTCVTPDGREILTVLFPVSPEYAQVTIDMCNAYNSDMVDFALDLARNGDFETALCICRQIRKLLPDLESCYPWDEMEKDLGNRNADLQYPYTRKGRLPSVLSRAFSEMGGYVAGKRAGQGTAPESAAEAAGAAADKKAD